MIFTGGVAQATTSVHPLSRAQFVEDLLVSLHIQPVYPATPDFKDLPSSSPYYGYIEAAYQDGLISGVGGGLFDPSGYLTRAQVSKILILALGQGTQAQGDMQEKTTFKDDTTFPAWSRGYIYLASQLGLIKGYPDNTFRPDAYLTTSDEPFFFSQYQAVLESLGPQSLTLAASPQDAAVGQEVTLSAAGVTASGATLQGVQATYTVDSKNAVITGSTFIGSAPGSYTVTGKAGDGATGTLTVSVYGSPTGLKVNAPTSVVANGVSTQTVSVDVVDANGATVASATDAINLTSSLSSVASIEGSGSATAVDGVATFTLQSGIIPGSSTTLTATDPGNSQVGAGPWQAAVASTSQVATSVGLTAASPDIENNDGAGQDVLTAVIDDQTGNPMLGGTFPLNLSVTSPGNFAGQSATTTAAFVGGTSGAPFTLSTQKGVTGPISVTAASSPGLTSGQVSVQSVTVGPPVAFQVTVDTANVTADDVVNSTYSNPAFHLVITTVDKNGYPTPWTGTAAVSGTIGGQDSFNNLSITQQEDFTGSSSVSDSVSWNLFFVAGTYTFSVEDTNHVLTSATTSLTITSGAPHFLNFTNPNTTVNLALGRPTVTLTAQVYDQSGDPLQVAGIPVEFSIDASSTNPSHGQLSQTEVLTGPDGTATTTFTAAPYPTDQYQIDAVAGPGAGFSSNATEDISLSDTTATALTATLKDAVTGGTQTTVGGNGLTLTVTGLDSFNNGVTSQDEIRITPPSGLDFGSVTGCSLNPFTGVCIADLGPTGSVTITGITATSTGSQTVQVEDASVLPQLTTAATVQVLPGSFSYFAIVDGAGEDLQGNNPPPYGLPSELFTPGVPTEVWIQAVDQGGNPIPFTGPTTSLIPQDFSNANGGEFRLTPGGSDVSQVTVPTGTSLLPLYFVNSTSLPSYDDLGTMLAPSQVTLSGAGTYNADQGAAGIPVTALVKTSSGLPVENAEVDFTVTGSGGYGNFTYTAYTNNSGLATVNLDPMDTVGNGATITASTPTPIVTSLPITVSVNQAGAPASFQATLGGGPTYTAGISFPVNLTNLKDAEGNLVGGNQTVNLTGVDVAPDGTSYGSLDSQTITLGSFGGSASETVAFTNGSATVNLTLDDASNQNPTFQVGGASAQTVPVTVADGTLAMSVSFPGAPIDGGGHPTYVAEIGAANPFEVTYQDAYGNGPTGTYPLTLSGVANAPIST